ncbi:hypothetical protein BS50DRAFT_583409 [Corynespora cassiicola Philippines]|uniref:Uncharacterized protein n=1 Tax=Corynespora cassiicola Philippines TaxID=1448308 RepID=A0A2T2P2B9_CORCC|nr:hypothetical protein BS50DRAFT_583409 [Corynespora cassiicola Philippines]
MALSRPCSAICDPSPQSLSPGKRRALQFRDTRDATVKCHCGGIPPAPSVEWIWITSQQHAFRDSHRTRQHQALLSRRAGPIWADFASSLNPRHTRPSPRRTGIPLPHHLSEHSAESWLHGRPIAQIHLPTAPSFARYIPRLPINHVAQASVRFLPMSVIMCNCPFQASLAGE